MSNRFQVPSDFSSPSTPDRSSRGSAGAYSLGDHPSTTPAGPPPSSAGSFTPAGAPTASYLGSSILRGMGSSSPKPPPALLGQPAGASKNLFTQQQKRNTPLGRSIVQGTKSHQPSRLSRQFVVDDESEAEPAKDTNKPGTFRMTYDDDDDDDDSYNDDAEKEREVDAMDEDAAGDDDGDLWLDMQDKQPDAPDSEESDLMMFTTPAATERVRREAEDIARASAVQTATRRREHKFAALAKDLYTQMGCAAVTEPAEIVLRTEAEVARLYDDGVGEADDAQKLDDALATVAARLASLWTAHAERLPRASDEEHAAEMGPGPHASAFAKATFLANLALQVHHTRLEDGDPSTTTTTTTEPLPETLFRWLAEHHNPYPEQYDSISRHRPSPACHGLFWQGVFIALLRGRVAEAQSLLAGAGWSHVRRGSGGGSEYAYAGQALANVERAVQDTCGVLGGCPGAAGNWEIGTSDWTLFRIRARGVLEQLRRFAEGRDEDGAGFGGSVGRQSVAGRARQAESRVPWEIYENLNIVFEIVLGSRAAILEAAQDWCEAAIGLFGWWDEGDKASAASLSRAQRLLLASSSSSYRTETDAYLDRLARAFQTAVGSDFYFNTLNPVEVGVACILEDNAKGLVGILRAWSLPIAAATAELASLGGWLPAHQASGLFALDDLDTDDLEVLGMDPGSPDEVDGIKDSTLIRYAQELAGTQTASRGARDGWELAITVLGRMDSPERSEEMVGELVRDLLEHLDTGSGATCDKVWRLLNELGMIALAEETAERYGDVLAQDSLRYGEAMWHYALAHRPDKVREVMNLLISYSLLQSTAYPPPADLDDHLRRLLDERNDTLKKLAAQDLEAAELLGKMLSGYASLRQFYELRDGGLQTSPRLRQQAAAALTSVIASSDDNIRGGLYDQTRDAIVSEDFLLVLLGEATVFVSEPDHAFNSGTAETRSEPAVTLDQIDILLKAIEDLETVGERVTGACEEFLRLALSSAPGVLKGSTPADLMRKSTSSRTGASSFVLAGQQSLAASSRLQKQPNNTARSVRRGWDWRTRVAAGTKGGDVLRRLRQGLAKDLARLWLEEADGVW